MKQFLIALLFTSLALLLSACGSDTPSAQLQAPPPAPPSPLPQPPAPIPSVVSSIPYDNAIGVSPNAIIQLRFNAPMNQASVEAAFSASTDSPVVISPLSTSETETSAQIILPPIIGGPQPIAGSFAWANSSHFVFTPTNPLPLGTWITVKLNQTAKDTSNRPLVVGYQVKFRVLRQFNTALPSNAALDGAVRKYGGDYIVHKDGTFIRIGDRLPVTNGTHSSHGYLSFDLSGLPIGAQITQATLNYKLLLISGNPVFQLGGLAAYGVNYGDSLDGSFSEFFTPSDNWCDDKVTFSLYRCPFAHVPVMGWNTVRVTPAVQYDWANRTSNGKRSQFRLGFYLPGNDFGSEDFIDISATESPDPSARPFLRVIYLAP